MIDCYTGSKPTFLPWRRKSFYFLVPLRIPRVTLKNNSTFKPVSKAAKTSQGLQQTPKVEPQITKKRILAKTCLLQYLHSETLVLRAPTVKNCTKQSMQKVTWKQARTNHNIERIYTKTTQTLVPDSHVSFLMLPWSPKVSPS